MTALSLSLPSAPTRCGVGLCHNRSIDDRRRMCVSLVRPPSVCVLGSAAALESCVDLMERRKSGVVCLLAQNNVRQLPTIATDAHFRAHLHRLCMRKAVITSRGPHIKPRHRPRWTRAWSAAHVRTCASAAMGSTRRRWRVRPLDVRGMHGH